MSDVPGDLADRLEATARAVEGVSAIYSAAPLLAQAVGELPVAATRAPALVQVTGDGASLAVTVSIGVDPRHPAPAVANDVAAAIREVVDADVDVVVRVARVAS